MSGLPASFALKFHGGADEVTGSRHLVEYGAHRFLMDYGLFQGHRRDALEKTKSFPTDPKTVTAVLLSHAHIDHSGGLPLLVKQGFAGPIHCTGPTAELLGIMLRDSAFLQEEDAKFFNKIHAAEGASPGAERTAEGVSIEPLYTQEDAERTLRLLVTHDYGAPFLLADGAEGLFLNAGHVLGSAMIRVSLKLERRTRHVLFTGDLGRRDTLLMNPPALPPHVDYLLIESTYGGRQHPDLGGAEAVLAEAVQRSEREGGPVLIPCFALERTQEILFLLGRLIDQKRIQPIHVYVDSPMAVDITHIFQKNLDSLSLSEDFRKYVAREGDPFGLEGIRYVKSVEDSKKLMRTPGRKIIMAGSGMCEGGRILHHLRNLVGKDDTTILLVGYQAQGTLGRRLADGAPEVKIFGLNHRVAARVQKLNHFSAHADQDDLEWFIQGLSPRPENVFLVHGEQNQREALAADLKARGIGRITLPRFGERFELQ